MGPRLALARASQAQRNETRGIEARTLAVEARFAALALAGLVVCRSAPASISEARADESGRGVQGVAVVELFTSEGCSSCPPADRLLADLADSSDRRIYALSFHVDYWDELGWPDRFASGAYTGRQQAYARALGVRGMYTPQMIVNGTEEFTGSDRDRAGAAVSRALARPSKVRLAMRPRSTAPNATTVDVDYEVSDTPAGASLSVSVVEHQAVTQVLRGENAGKTLRHENVVRSLAAVPLTASTGSVVVQVPSSLVRTGAELVGWVQRAPSLEGGMPVLGAARAPLPSP